MNAPSYKRADDVKTLSYLPYCRVWVDHKEYGEYRKNYPEAEIISCPEGVQGNLCRIRNYILDPSSSQAKVELMYRIATTDCIDDIVPYLNGCIDILSEGRTDDDSTYQIARLMIMRSKVSKNVPLSEEELREAKEIVRGSYGH